MTEWLKQGYYVIERDYIGGRGKIATHSGVELYHSRWKGGSWMACGNNGPETPPTHILAGPFAPEQIAAIPKIVEACREILNIEDDNGPIVGHDETGTEQTAIGFAKHAASEALEAFGEWEES